MIVVETVFRSSPAPCKLRIVALPCGRRVTAVANPMPLLVPDNNAMAIFASLGFYPSVYRTVDREHPILIIDEADDLFYRKSDLRAIVNAGWSASAV